MTVIVHCVCVMLYRCGMSSSGEYMSVTGNVDDLSLRSCLAITAKIPMGLGVSRVRDNQNILGLRVH